ncbi:MAG: S-layer homology domain-containing protein [Lachnospiraceae bacterium]|nr:S-layer homology domain-containing protein [Lachnospiraceae bacterium]
MTKLQKKLTLTVFTILIIAVFGLTYTIDAKANDGDIPIDSAHFPDPNFMTFVLRECDTDHDGILSLAERTSRLYIDVESYGYDDETDSGDILVMNDLTGLEYFPSLKELWCANNNLTQLNISGNSELELLLCSGNKLTYLDAGNHTKLTEINCSENNLTGLNISGCTGLKSLVCNDNKLTSLDISTNTALEALYCDNNKLYALTAGNNISLKTIYCQRNGFTGLNFGFAPNLEELCCSENKLEQLNVSNNTVLKELYCDHNNLADLNAAGCTNLNALICSHNKLSSLNISKNTELRSLFVHKNPLTKLIIANNPYLVKAYKSGNTEQVEDLDGEVYLYYFYADDRGEEYYDFSTNPNVPVIDVGTVENIFDDVYPNQWYVSAIQFVYDAGLMIGKGYRFGTADHTTREEFVQILYALSSRPPVENENEMSFPDVAQDAYYAKAILWAKRCGFVNGNGDGNFGVGQPIHREAVAQIFYKYTIACRYDASFNANALDGFIDVADVSPWAKDALCWSVGKGIIGGKPASNGQGLLIDPGKPATRAEIAQMIKKYIDFWVSSNPENDNLSRIGIWGQK